MSSEVTPTNVSINSKLHSILYCDHFQVNCRNACTKSVIVVRTSKFANALRLIASLRRVLDGKDEITPVRVTSTFLITNGLTVKESCLLSVIETTMMTSGKDTEEQLRP
jgi:hypothetical protein